jgi:hypothetical protein
MRGGEAEHCSLWYVRPLGFGVFGMVGTSRDAPVPGGHGGLGDGSIRGKGGVDDGETRAPFEVGDESGTEFGVGGKLELVGGFEEPDPALALLLGDAFAEVVADHGGVSAVEGGVVGGAAEDFGDELGYVPKVLLRHGGEEWCEERVGGDFLVEAVDETVEDFVAAEPFIQGGDFGRHGGIL